MHYSFASAIASKTSLRGDMSTELVPPHPLIAPDTWRISASFVASKRLSPQDTRGAAAFAAAEVAMVAVSPSLRQAPRKRPAPEPRHASSLSNRLTERDNLSIT
jgi:hypothetical protein